jgi:hypothetical protein
VKNFIKDIMATINMNGVKYEGSTVVIRNNKVTVNGVDVTPDTKIINILVEGDVEKVSADYCEKIVIAGNAKSVQTTSGDIQCKDVEGNVVTTSGEIECGNVGGNVQTVSGDVKAENITGKVNTLSGDIKYKKEKV